MEEKQNKRNLLETLLEEKKILEEHLEEIRSINPQSFEEEAILSIVYDCFKTFLKQVGNNEPLHYETNLFNLNFNFFDGTYDVNKSTSKILPSSIYRYNIRELSEEHFTAHYKYYVLTPELESIIAKTLNLFNNFLGIYMYDTSECRGNIGNVYSNYDKTNQWCVCDDGESPDKLVVQSNSEELIGSRDKKISQYFGVKRNKKIK